MDVRRRRAVVAVAALGIAAWVAAHGRGGRQPGAPTLTLDGPRIGAPLRFSRGEPMAGWAPRPGILVLPNRLAPWARSGLARLGGPSRGRNPALWVPGAEQVRWVAEWATPGLREVSVPALKAEPGVSPVLVRLVAAALPRRRARLVAEPGPGGVWRTAWVSPRPVPTTADRRWQRALAAALPAGSAAVLVAPSGAILAAAAGPGPAPSLAAPGPVGSALVPVVLAEALGQWWHGAALVDPSPAVGLAMASGRWGPREALVAYRRLGLGQPPLPGVPTVPLPEAAAVSPASLIFRGQGVWASALAVARAWLVLGDGGRLLPVVRIEARAERVWFSGPGAPAVVLVRTAPDQPAVLVAVGLNDGRALTAFLTRLAHGAGEERTVSKANPPTR